MVTIGAGLGKGVAAQMTVKRITSDVVNRLQAGERVSDDKLPGFRVRRQTTTRRVYEFNYYINGVRKQMKIGVHGMVTPDGITSWTPDAARREAKRLAGLVAQGIDPKADRPGKGAPTVKDLFDRYIAEHVKRLRKDSTAREYKGAFKKHLSAPLGHRKVAEITRADVEKLHRELRVDKDLSVADASPTPPIFQTSPTARPDTGWR